MLYFIVIFSDITVNYCEVVFELLIAIAIKLSRILNYRDTFTKIDKNILELCLQYRLFLDVSLSNGINTVLQLSCKKS